MGIVHTLDFPGERLVDRDADLLLQLAAQRLLDGLTRFNLAARKLPVAGIGLADRPGSKQELAIGPQQHTHRDLDRLAISAAFAWTVTIGHAHSLDHRLTH